MLNFKKLIFRFSSTCWTFRGEWMSMSWLHLLLLCACWCINNTPQSHRYKYI